MKLTPRITIVTPVLNGGLYLSQTLASVRALKYPNLEYIVCDGGSTDGSLELLEQNRDIITHLVHRQDHGMYDALAHGFSLSTGEILGWINADDLLFPWALACVAEYFVGSPKCDWVTGIPAVLDAQDRLLWVANVAPHYCRQWIANGWYSGLGLGTIQQECTFWRRSLYDRVGGLNGDLKWGGDLDLWRRFAASGSNLEQIGTVLAGFRMHANNASANYSRRYHEEGGAKRIWCGRILGYTYSFGRFLLDRWVGKSRLSDQLLSR